MRPKENKQITLLGVDPRSNEFVGIKLRRNHIIVKAKAIDRLTRVTGLKK